MTNSPDFSRRKQLKEEVKKAFERKGVLSLHDKRRVLKSILGYAPTFSSIKEEELEKVLTILQNRSEEHLKSPVVAWAYLVEAESGLSKKQLRSLMEQIPGGIEVYPFAINETSLIKANSTAIGFVHNDYAEEVDTIKQTLAAVCNDFEKERADELYALPGGLKVQMMCDAYTIGAEKRQG